MTVGNETKLICVGKHKFKNLLVGKIRQRIFLFHLDIHVVEWVFENKFFDIFDVRVLKFLR